MFRPRPRSNTETSSASFGAREYVSQPNLRDRNSTTTLPGDGSSDQRSVERPVRSRLNVRGASRSNTSWARSSRRGSTRVSTSVFASARDSISCGLIRMYAASIFDVSAGSPSRIRSCPCSAGSSGENTTSPSPRSTSAVMPCGDSAMKAVPDGIFSVRSGASKTKLCSANCFVRSIVSLISPSMAAISPIARRSNRVEDGLPGSATSRQVPTRAWRP